MSIRDSRSHIPPTPPRFPLPLGFERLHWICEWGNYKKARTAPPPLFPPFGDVNGSEDEQNIEKHLLHRPLSGTGLPRYAEVSTCTILS
jgi:hypothetical protein